MTKLAWFCVCFGVLVAVCILSVCIYDPYAVATGGETVSRTVLVLGDRHPWLVALLTATLLLPVAILIGHLWGHAARPGGAAMWPVALAAAVVVLALGVWAGRAWFAQQ